VLFAERGLKICSVLFARTNRFAVCRRHLFFPLLIFASPSFVNSRHFITNQNESVCSATLQGKKAHLRRKRPSLSATSLSCCSPLSFLHHPFHPLTTTLPLVVPQHGDASHTFIIHLNISIKSLFLHSDAAGEAHTHDSPSSTLFQPSPTHTHTRTHILCPSAW